MRAITASTAALTARVVAQRLAGAEHGVPAGQREHPSQGRRRWLPRWRCALGAWPIGAMSGPWPRHRARPSSHSQNRVLHPRLGKAGHAAGFASRLTTRRTIRSLLRGALSAMSRVSAVSAWGLVVQLARGRLRAGRHSQTVFVELVEQAPGVGVTRDEIQHSPPGVVHQRLVLQRPGQEIQRLTRFAQAAARSGCNRGPDVRARYGWPTGGSPQPASS